MSKNNKTARNRRYILSWPLVSLLAASSVLADPITQARNVESIYSGHFEIDQNNPASVTVETLMVHQKISIRLTSKALNTTVFNALGLGTEEEERRGAKGVSRCPGRSGDRSCNSTAIQPTRFSQFQVWIEGCNVSSQIVSLCNASNCWATNPTTPHPVDPPGPASSLGPDFSMAKAVSLNEIEPGSCPAGTFVGFRGDNKYQFNFIEAGAAGGRVDYEIRIPNQSTAPVARKE